MMHRDKTRVLEEHKYYLLRSMKTIKLAQVGAVLIIALIICDSIMDIPALRPTVLFMNILCVATMLRGVYFRIKADRVLRYRG